MKVGKKKVTANVEKLAIDWRGSQVVQQSFKGHFTRDDIKKFAQEQSDELKAQGVEGHVSVALRYPENWRGGYFTPMGKAVELFKYMDSDNEQADPEYYEAFTMYVLKTREK